jgi:uncharacterized protein YidB (DUF937 family)
MATSNSSRLIALLGLLAVAGYQNRDKLGGLLGSLGGGRTNPAGGPGADAGFGGLLGGLGGMLAGSGGGLRGGLGDLIDHFTGNGQGDAARSWVETGPNKELSPSQLEQTLGPEVIEALTRQTGLPRDELLARLNEVLPTAVDKLTPNGRLPTEDEARGWS